MKDTPVLDLLPTPEQTASLAARVTLTAVYEVAATPRFPAFCVCEGRTSRGGSLSIHIPHPFWIRVEQFLSPHPTAHLLCVDVFEGEQPAGNMAGKMDCASDRRYPLVVDLRSPDAPACLAALGYVAPSFNSPDLPRLTLTSIERPKGKDNTVTLHVLDGEGRAVALTMLRPLHVRPGFPMPRYAGMPVRISISPQPLETLEGAQQAVHFNVYPETPEGRAVLESMGYAGQLDADSEEEDR